MFNNRSFTVVIALALLGVITVMFGTGVGTPPAVTTGVGYEAPYPPGFETGYENSSRPNDYAALKEAQLEQRDAEQFGSASITVAGGEDSYLAMQKEQRAMQKELSVAMRSTSSAVSAPAISARSERYVALKEAQLEQRDAVQFGGASLTAAGKEDDLLTMQKEQRAALKELRAALKSATVPNKCECALIAPNPCQ